MPRFGPNKLVENETNLMYVRKMISQYFFTILKVPRLKNLFRIIAGFSFQIAHFDWRNFMLSLGDYNCSGFISTFHPFSPVVQGLNSKNTIYTFVWVTYLIDTNFCRCNLSLNCEKLTENGIFHQNLAQKERWKLQDWKINQICLT